METCDAQNHDQKSKILHPLDIDAHWIQRKLSKYFDDATDSQKKSQDVMEILKNADSDRECENHLVLLLGYDCFEFIKVLLKNRDMITYCIRLKMAQSDDERDKIVHEMKKRSHLRRIVNQLKGNNVVSPSVKPVKPNKPNKSVKRDLREKLHK